MPLPQSSAGSVAGQSMSGKHILPDPAQEITFEDLGMMHFYSISTCHTLNAVPEAREIWQTLVPEEAVSRPYLMHSLLALTALHKISLGTVDCEPCLALATKHHSLALAKSKTELDNLSEHNCHALFAFSAIIAVYTLALPVLRNAVSMKDPINEIASTAITMRGSSTIVQWHKDDLSRGKYGALLRPCFLFKKSDMPERMVSALNDLEIRVKLYDKDRPDLAGCSLAFERLRICFMNMHFHPEGHTISVDPGDRAVMWSWLATVDLEFISLLFEHEPMALILLAHYSILLHALNEVWWIRGWGVALIRSISGFVGEDWEPALRWPMQQTGLETEHVSAV